MQLPIDTSQLRMRVVVPPTEDRDYETQQVRHRDGRPVYLVVVAVMDGQDAEQIRVRVPGPVEVAPDDQVQLRGLRARSWRMGERSGVSYSADSITRHEVSDVAASKGAK